MRRYQRHHQPNGKRMSDCNFMRPVYVEGRGWRRQCVACGRVVFVNLATAEVTTEDCEARKSPRTVYVNRYPLTPLFARLARPWRLVRSFVRARRVWRDADRPRPSTEDAAARLAACLDCPLRGKGVLADRCTKCGCFLRWKTLAVKWLQWLPLKIEMATEHCPIGKWPGDPKSNCSSCEG